jgi:hypothetical protein
MRKAIYALLAGLCASCPAMAAPGDTTWVQAQNNIQLDAYGAFDAAVSFPSGTVAYRKIYMEFTLGTYICPGTPQYCHQWDYTVQNILMTPGGDTLELSRFITPYANAGVPRFPANWKHRYIFDVTDYYPLLKNNAALRIFYSGYSYGFTANVRFAFIEGTPERDVTGITRLWRGAWDYGRASDPIDNHVVQRSVTAPAGTQSAELKFLVTGHGSDATSQCCEFAKKEYEVILNGSGQGPTSIWRSDCGFNQLYPQGGTWIYDRGNWCPGAIVNVNNHKLTGQGGGPYTIDVDFESYTNTAGTAYGSYIVSGNVIHYAGYNKNTDASLEAIIAPTDFEAHFRENPAGSPIIRVRNSGSATITSMLIKYSVQDSNTESLMWTGSLPPLAETQITLPELPTLKNLSLSGAPGTYQFVAQITEVNGRADDDAYNDTLRSFFTVAPAWPNTVVVYMKTNSAGVSGVGQNPSETSWQITDAQNNVIASRTNADVNTTYSDTVSFPRTGFYKLTVSDAGCDGLHWWIWDVNPSFGVTAGNFIIRNSSTGISIPVKGSNYSSPNYHDDFGCGFVQYFTAPGWPAGVHPASSNGQGRITAYPNPAQNVVRVMIDGLTGIHGEIRIIDAVGRVVLAQQAASAASVLAVGHLASGIYNLVYTDDRGIKISSRFTISK